MPSKKHLKHVDGFYDHLDRICIEGLKRSLNPVTKVFDLQLMDAKRCNTNEHYTTEDLTSTAICLIGINRAMLDSGKLGLKYEETFDYLYRLARKRNYIGGFGLLLWATAVCGGDIDILERASGQSTEQAVASVAKMTTMEAAWLLSGILHEYKRTRKSTLFEFINIVSSELVENRYIEKTKIAAHCGPDAPVKHKLRRWIANFADQIYTVQALAFNKIVTSNEVAFKTSSSIAKQMIEFQGEYGQWWWHYDAKRGGSPQPYPVYSVHQHGMAPMALYALSKAGNAEFNEAQYKSLNWLYDNELGCHMVDENQPTIWRNIYCSQGSINSASQKARSLLGLANDQSKQVIPNTLKVNFETRPYELAWCLYAGAIARRIEPSLHII